MSWWLDIDTPPLVFSVVVHVGTTVAVLTYFWREWYALLHAAWTAVRTRNFSIKENTELRLLALLIFGTIPAGVAGLLFADFFEDQFSEPAIVSLALLITAALLVYGEQVRNEELSSDDTIRSDKISFVDSLIIGSAQALAIMPGISRSGSTIAAGLFRNLSRAAATRYSFLLATPIILAAGALQALDLITGAASIEDGLGGALVAGFITSTVVGYICIALMLRFVRNRSLYGFALYCVVFGLVSFGAVMVQG